MHWPLRLIALAWHSTSSSIQRIPQPRLIERAAEIVRHGGLIVYPTDSCYALGCHIGDKEAMERMRAIRRWMRAITSRWCAAICPRSGSTRGSTTARTAAQGRHAGQLHLHPARRPAKCRDACRIPSARPSACACPIIRWRRRCWTELDEPLLSSTLMLPGDECR